MEKLGSLDIFDSGEIVAIGDIHGERLKLEKLIKKVWKFLDNPKCHLVFCGDYFDRGPNSPGVFEFLLDLKSNKPDQIYFVRGNHEVMLWETIVEKQRNWLTWTELTLDQMVNYWQLKNEVPDRIDQDFNLIPSWDWCDREDLKIIENACESKGFLNFLKNLLPYYESKDVICTHAPVDAIQCKNYFSEINPPKPLLDTINVYWPFIKEERQTVIPKIDKFLICGHQAARDHNDPRIFNRRAFIDTGCGLSPKRPLTAFRYPNRTCFQEY